eukprot:1500824-Pyramimonas_sp.AAC.1
MMNWCSCAVASRCRRLWMSPVLAILSLEHAPCKVCKVFAKHLHHTASLAAGGTLAPPKLSGLTLQVGPSARPAAG